MYGSLKKLFLSGSDLTWSCLAALQINIIPLTVTMNRKIKKPPVKLNFRRSQENNE